MKSPIVFLVFVFSSSILIGQSKNQITNWFYDLPLKKNGKALKKAIQKNVVFVESNASKNYNFKNSLSCYWGVINSPSLPVLSNIDSSKITLTKGTLFNKVGYSGSMKWLRFEYFSSDTVYLNQLFDSACFDFKNNAKVEKKSGFRDQDKVVGKGKEYIYIDELDELRSISIMRVRYSVGTQSFSINYSESND
jgi:hypothetical protein